MYNVSYKHSEAIIRIANFLLPIINHNTAIICIGTDKCIVDSLGPIVGTLLKEGNAAIDVYGTLNEPIHALNIARYVNILKGKNYDKIIAIDACLSNRLAIGSIELKEDSIKPGKGLGKILPEIGDYSIVGIVETSGKEFHELAQDTRLSLVYDMSKIIVKSILLAEEIRLQRRERIWELNMENPLEEAALLE